MNYNCEDNPSKKWLNCKLFIQAKWFAKNIFIYHGPHSHSIGTPTRRI